MKNNHQEKAKTNFDTLLAFYDQYQRSDNAITTYTYTYTFDTFDTIDTINIQFFPFSPDDITLSLDMVSYCQNQNDVPIYHIPQLLLSTPYFDIRNISVYINPTEYNTEKGKITDIKHAYYIYTYTYTLPNGEEVHIPALFPYYTVAYPLKSHERNMVNTLRISYEEHTLETYNHIDHSSLFFQ